MISYTRPAAQGPPHDVISLAEDVDDPLHVPTQRRELKSLRSEGSSLFPLVLVPVISVQLLLLYQRSDPLRTAFFFLGGRAIPCTLLLFIVERNEMWVNGSRNSLRHMWLLDTLLNKIPNPTRSHGLPFMPFPSQALSL